MLPGYITNWFGYEGYEYVIFKIISNLPAVQRSKLSERDKEKNMAENQEKKVELHGVCGVHLFKVWGRLKTGAK